MNNYLHIKQFNSLSSTSSKEKVIKELQKLMPFYRGITKVNPDGYIFRARIGNYELIPKISSELSYNPKASLGRANPKDFPVFYGCSHPDFSKIIQNLSIKTAIHECSNILRNPNHENGIELGCVSRWKFTKPLKLFQLFNYNFGIQTDQFILDEKEKLISKIQNSSPNPERDIEINNWLSTLFAEKFEAKANHKYHITSILAKNFMSNGHDGIVYPTVQGKGSALNIALNSNSADTLELEYVARIVIVKKNNKAQIVFLKQSEDILNGKILSWQNCFN